MLGKLFSIGLALVPALSLAQSLSKRSEAIYLEVKPGKTPRTYLAYENVRFEDADGNRTIEPAEPAYIRFTIINRSTAHSQRVYVTTSLAENVPGLQLPEPIGLHPVGPEKSFAVEIPLQASSDLGPGVAVLSIEIREADVFEADVIQLNVLTSGGISAIRKRNR